MRCTEKGGHIWNGTRSLGVSDEEKKIYSKEFKSEALRQWEQGGQSARAVASSLGLPRSALYKWKEQLSQQGKDAFQGLGCRPAGPPNELTRLKKELADTEMERDILKKAAAYLARQRK